MAGGRRSTPRVPGPCHARPHRSGCRRVRRTAQIGTLLALYLLAQRAFSGFDGIVDLSLATKSARGAVNRCFEYIDAANDQRSIPSAV